MVDLKRLSRELDERLSRLELKKPKEEHSSAVTEAKLRSELECLEKEAQTLEIEIKILNKKVKVNTNYARVIELEKKLAMCSQRNEMISKELKGKDVKMEQEEKKIRFQFEKLKEPPQKEEERLLKCIIKEDEKSDTMEARIKKEPEYIKIRQCKADALRCEILTASEQIEKLKNKAKENATKNTANECVDELDKKSTQELKDEFCALQNEYENGFKLNTKIKSDLEGQIYSCQLKLKEICYVI